MHLYAFIKTKKKKKKKKKKITVINEVENKRF